MNYNGFENMIIPKAFLEHDSLIKNITSSPISQLQKDLLSAVSRMPDNATITAINKTALNFAAAYKTILPVAEEAVRMIYNSRLFTDALATLVNIHNLPEYSRIINTVAFVQNSLPYALDNLQRHIDSIGYLQNIKSNYEMIVSSQKESFENVTHLKSFQKRRLLRAELQQKETLALGPVDFENSEVIASSVNNTIELVDELSFNRNSYNVFNNEWLVQKEGLYAELIELDIRYVDLLEGAKTTALSDNPDKARQVATSLRELLKKLINLLMPTDEVCAFCKNTGIIIRGKPSINDKVDWFFSGIKDSQLASFIVQEAQSIKDILDLLNGLIHNFETRISDRGLQYIIMKVESYIFLLLKYNRNRN